jgi:hypothetical protein
MAPHGTLLLQLLLSPVVWSLQEDLAQVQVQPEVVFLEDLKQGLQTVLLLRRRILAWTKV